VSTLVYDGALLGLLVALVVVPLLAWLVVMVLVFEVSQAHYRLKASAVVAELSLWMGRRQ